MSSGDLDLRCGIQNALTRRWIDLTKTNFLVRRGHVHMSGEVSMLGAPRPREETAGVLKAVESDVRRLREVKSVTFEFTNWIRGDSGEWSCKTKELEPASATEGTAPDGESNSN